MKTNTLGTVRWLQWIAGACGLLALIALLLMWSPRLSQADDPGFQSPPPGMPQVGSPPPMPMDTEFDDDFDFSQDPYNSGAIGAAGNMNPGAINPALNARGARPQGNVATAPHNVSGNDHSMGGTDGGVLNKSKTDAITLDSESGEGSKEMVTDFNFPDADIMDIAKTLGKLTGKNFILDKDVKGRITIISNSPITVGDAWKAFLTALDINGFALIPSGKYIRIARQRDARDKQLRTFTGDYAPDSDALITRLFPLKYLSAEEVARNFRSFMPANSRIIPYEQTNTVIVTDTGANIAKLAKLLDILDVEGYDAGIEVIPVKYASAVELSKLIDTLVPGTGTGGGAGGAGGAPRFGGGGGRFSARRTKEGGIINTILADERTNTLIVHANTRGADQVRALVAKLDQRLPASTGGGKVHVVYLQFSDSEQIANTLNNLSSQSGSKPAAGGAGSGTGVNPVQASLFEGSIKISPDKSTNSLVITASPGDFVTVQRVINKLDIPRDQVFAEVVIMEITMGRNFTFATNAAALTPTSNLLLLPNSDIIDFATNPLGSKGAILSFSGKDKQEILVGGQKTSVSSIQGLIKAIQTNSNGNILATPQIMTLDNTEATFETSERIPVPQSTASQGTVSSSVGKENVSLSITIKPQIVKLSPFVKMEVTAKLEDFSDRELPAQVKDLAYATVSRNAKTSLVVSDKDTVVLGGLTRDNRTETVSKIPLLGDIPILGWLFKSKRSQSNKTNLLIFITPQIIRQYEKVRTVLDRKLKERDDFIEGSAGGEDPMREYRDRMIRDLPEAKDIAIAPKPKVETIDTSTPPSVIEVPEDDEEKTSEKPSEQGNAAQIPAIDSETPPGQVAGQAAGHVE